jgi:ribosome-interacting GTPase 1
VHEDGNKQVRFILGEPTSHSNKVEFTCDASYDEFTTNILPFNSAHIKEILAANKNDIIEAKGYLSMKGLLKLEITTETGKSIYYLPELRTT